MLWSMVVILVLCAEVSKGDKQSFVKTRSRSTRSTKFHWPIQCLYTSMINQDNTWYLYRPILDCCYACRNPYYKCMKRSPHWFCYRGAFTCSSACVLKSYIHGKDFPKQTMGIVKNSPLGYPYYSRKSPPKFNGHHNGQQSAPARRPNPGLPCVGRKCNGELCFFTLLCYKVEPRHLKNVPLN